MLIPYTLYDEFNFIQINDEICSYRMSILINTYHYYNANYQNFYSWDTKQLSTRGKLALIKGENYWQQV